MSLRIESAWDLFQVKRKDCQAENVRLRFCAFAVSE